MKKEGKKRNKTKIRNHKTWLPILTGILSIWVASFVFYILCELSFIDVTSRSAQSVLLCYSSENGHCLIALCEKCPCMHMFSRSVISVFATLWSAPGSSVHGILQARILQQVATSSSTGSSWPRDLLCLLHCRQILTCWAIREALIRDKYAYLHFKDDKKRPQRSQASYPCSNPNCLRRAGPGSSLSPQALWCASTLPNRQHRKPLVNQGLMKAEVVHSPERRARSAGHWV